MADGASLVLRLTAGERGREWLRRRENAGHVAPFQRERRGGKKKRKGDGKVGGREGAQAQNMKLGRTARWVKGRRRRFEAEADKSKTYNNVPM